MQKLQKKKGKMFTSLENKVLKFYENQLKNDKSIKNIIDVFIENYSRPDKKYNRRNDEDMLLFQYGVYDWGKGKNLEIDFVRQLAKKDKIMQVYISIKVPYQEEMANIESFEEWFNSENAEITLEEWKQKIEKMPVLKNTDSKNYSVEIWKENAE